MDLRNRLKSAVRDGKAKEVQDILESSPPLQLSVYYKHDLLRNCIDLQHIEIAKLLLSKSFELIYPNKKPFSLLYNNAIINEDAGMVNVLLKMGVDPSVPEATEESSRCFSPIFVAIDRGSFEILKLLIERGIDVNDCDENSGLTPLGSAVIKGNVRIAELLLQHGANVNRAQFDQEQSTLHYAVERVDLDMVNLLLSYKKVKVDPEIKAFYKKRSKMWTSSFYYVYYCLLTPFETSLERRHRNIAKVLLMFDNNDDKGRSCPQQNKTERIIKNPIENCILQ